jgi:CRISPR/Cas system-associated endoribonuclease Cas2
MKYKWCVYGLITKQLGKIIEDNDGTVRIQYSEKQMYPCELWEDKKCYVLKFKTIKEAMQYKIKKDRDEIRIETMLDIMYYDFKEAKKYRKFFINNI